jgi:hypothetical protein
MEKFDYKRRMTSPWTRRRLRCKLVKGGLWFVDIPRTSSTSIKVELGRKLGALYGKCYDRQDGHRVASPIEDHTPAVKMRRLIGQAAWEQLFTFSFVRNPWERFYSIYRFRQADGNLPESLSFDAYVEKLCEFRFRDHHSPYSRHEYHFPMLDYLLDENESLLVEEVFKVEERDAAMQRLAEKTGFDLSTERKETLATVGEYRQAYNRRSREIIAQFYRDDIDYFRYEF